MNLNDLSIILKRELLRKRLLYFLFSRLGKVIFNIKYANSDLFQHINIQTNYKCTRQCDFCYYGIDGRGVLNGEMTEQMFYDIINQLAKVSYAGRISLFEINEPLTDKRIFSFLEITSSNLPLAWIYLNSNGDLITTEIIKNLFAAGLDQLDICSYDQQAEIKINQIINELRPLHFNIRHLIRYKQNFITSNRGGRIKKYFPNNNCDYDLCCDRVFKIMYVKPNGDVVSCFEDMFSENVLGNLSQDKLLDIWFGDKFTNLRRQLGRGNRSVTNLCRRCNYIGWGGHYKIPKGLHKKKIKKI